jgi:hypothetical protein
MKIVCVLGVNIRNIFVMWGSQSQCISVIKGTNYERIGWSSETNLLFSATFRATL